MPRPLPAPRPRSWPPRPPTGWAPSAFPARLGLASPARSGRHGGELSARLGPLGSWRSGALAGEAFVVSPPGQAPWALVDVSYGGRLGYGPTPAGLPVGGGQLPPQAGHVVAVAREQVPQAVDAWLQATWGPHGSLSGVVGLGAAGSPEALVGWRPSSGGEVWRISVPLSSSAPGGAAAVAAVPAVIDARALATVEASAARSAKAVSVARAALASAERPRPGLDAVGQAQAALAAAAASRTGLGVASAQAALAAAQDKTVAPVPSLVATAKAGLVAAEGREAQASAAVPAATERLARARDAAAQAPHWAAVGTYDVWARAGTVVGWAPAGYEAP